MSSGYELIETIKNGPLRKGECLLVVNGKTCRISITNLSVDFSVDSVPNIEFSGMIMPNNTQDLIDTITELQEDR